MSVSLNSTKTPFIQLTDPIDYPESGVRSKIIWKSEQCQYSLFCLAAQTEISEHTSPRNATVQVMAGTGVLTLNDDTIQLAPGIFVSMPANAPHALAAASNLAFMLTLSKVG